MSSASSISRTLAALTLGLTCAGSAYAAAGGTQVWTDPAAADLPADVRIQGEYVGATADGAKLGCQVIALGDGQFSAVVYPGGLPGDGWDAKSKIVMSGATAEGTTSFKPADGTRKYLAQKPEEFSPTGKFPPEGHKPYTATIADGAMSGATDDGKAFTLKRTVRESPTLGAKPPAGAVVLFDGTGTAEWKGGRLDEKTRLLNTDGKDIVSNRKFLNYTVHAEFMLPYRPHARGQGRGNSGFYQVDQYEVQVLDAFGLDGKYNETGGIYSKVAPKLMMCLPPLQWQTYDIDFTAAQAAEGKKVKNAVITVRLNGVVVHENQEIDGVTGGARKEPEGTPGPLRLQGHGNPLQWRNIWIVEKQ